MENELPNGWIEIELGKVMKLHNGNAFKSSDYVEDGVPIIRMSDIDGGLIKIDKAARVKEKPEYEKYVIKKGDILIGMSGSIGKYGIFNLNKKAYLNQRVGNLKLFSEKHFEKRLLLYLIGKIQQEIIDKAYGGTVPNVSGLQIESTKIPLPPHPEQKRIVAKLDTLFGHLDALKTRLDHIPQLLKDFRQKVLTQAVTGKLTEECREGRELEEWQIENSENLTSYVTSGSRGWADYYSSEGEVFLRITNINRGTLELDLREEKIQRVKLASNTEGTRTRVKENDILISITADVGMIAIVPKILDGKAYVNQHIALVRLKDGSYPKFIAYYLLSSVGMEQFQSKKRGVTKTGLTLGDIRNLEFNIPPIHEQQEIVRRVESLFAKADQIEASYQKLKTKIEQLPQALLAKAFRGELVEQLPTDGDARDLLKQIKLAKEGLEKGGKSRKIKVKDEVRMVAEDGARYGKK